MAFRLICALYLPLASLASPALAHAQQSWVERSNVNTHLMIEMEATFVPEVASINGAAEYDGLAMDLGPKLHERSIAAAETLLQEYEKRLATETDKRVRQDLEILIANLHQKIEGEQLDEEFMLAWENVPETAHETLSALLADQIAPERRAKSLELLRRYVGMHPGSTALAKQAKARFDESDSPGKIGPYRAEVEEAIANIPTYTSGIRELFETFEIQGAEDALDEMDKQFADYGEWEKATILPRSRTEYREPPEIYAFRLKEAGIDIDPLILVERARVGYFETRAALAVLAPLVAEKLGLDAKNYPDVIRALKRDSIPDDQLVAQYTDVMTKLEQSIRGEAVVSLPDYPVKMRLSSAAEAAAQPAPHMQPPPLIGNRGEQGQFILPVAIASPSGERQSFNDFNFPAATWTLSAHEARPGHELQFATMVDRGVSQARALYAFNSVNAEGWALYAEAEMIPYEPIEGQLIALQHRLMRAARAFIDPMLNLGLMDIKDAERILAEEVVLSPGMVKQELDRYTFRDPGQAASYFYGYNRLLDMRLATEVALGSKFNRLAFNDFVLDQGMLPPDLLKQAVKEEFVPTQ